MRTILWGAAPVMSRPSRRTLPLSGRKCPVIRLNSVDLPAPFGPVSTVRSTSETARNPEKDLPSPRSSSTAGSPQAPPQGVDAAQDAAREAEQQHQQDHAEEEGPILRVVGDFLVEPDDRESADR